MSIANAKQQKRIGKKQSNVSTAAVYPILQENNTKTNKNEPNVDLLNSPIGDNEVSVNINHIKAQCVRGRPAVEHTIASSVVELVSEVIPQGNAPHNLQSEPICWVKIQKCQCDFRGRNTTFVIVIGLARGYQIWTMLENGDCEEVASERKGPLRCAHLLPFVTEGVDKFADQRPLFAMVDGNPMSSDHKHRTLSFLSLKSGKVVHSIDFAEPIIDIESSEKFLLVALSEKLVVCDHETLTQRLSVGVPPSADGMPPCYAISYNLLAFAEFSLDKQKQSCGGLMPDSELSYGGQVLSAAKSLTKTMASIGESFVSSFTSSSQCKKASSNADSLATTDTGIVSVINVNNLSSSNKNSLQHYIAHFIAHDNAFIGYLSMGNGGNLLLTGTQGSTTFHLFLLHPHPTSVRLSSVQHIYTLHRGNSSAKVLHSAFSLDNRWLSISTNHGTTHVYAITPYGGPVNARTHCGPFVNKESRFQRSAGISSIKQINAIKNHHNSLNKSGRPFVGFREHPALMSHPVMSKASLNPRLTFYEPPMQLYSLAKLKHRAFSAENWSAWASDNTPSLLCQSSGGSSSASGRHHSFNGQSSLSGGAGSWWGDSSIRRMAVAFDASFDSTAPGEDMGYTTTNKSTQVPSLCMYIMNGEGIFMEHKIEIRYENQTHHNGGSTATLSGSNDSLASCNGNNVVNTVTRPSTPQDAAIRAKVSPVMQWTLRRGKGASNIEVIDPPLSPSNSLMCLYNNTITRLNALNDLSSTKERSDAWLRQVEVVTYSGPHRRLWMGPQFSFGIYAKAGHSSAQLFNPKNALNENTMYPSMQKCCPVLIEKNPIMTNGFNNSSTSRIVCGSWSSDIVDPLSTLGDVNYASVKEKIEDAMRDISEPPHQENTKKKVTKKRGPTTKSSSSSLTTNDSVDLLNLSGMEL